MTSLKTVLLGSTASLLAVGVAQAADLPVKKAAAAVQYVEVCPVYGAGFYKLPGTDICVRHFGSMKFVFGVQDERSAYREGPDFGRFRIEAGASNTTGWEWTIRPGWDFRSPTEYGTLRAVVQLRVDQRNGVFESLNPALTGTMRTSNLIHRGYIEWAGFLIGRAGSQFPYWDQDDVLTAIGGDPKTTAMQVTYVFTAPGGFKATIGLEDSTPWIAGDGFINANVAPPNTPTILVGPQRFYDVVGSMSTEQSWGNAKIAGALHHTATAANLFGSDRFGTSKSPETSEDHWGYGLLAGITFNLPMLGAKDQLLLEATYCKAASAYCGLNGGAENNLTTFERSGNFMAGLQRNDVDVFLVADANGRGYHFEDTKAWTIDGQLRHYWTPLWRTNVMASFQSIDAPRVANRGVGGGNPGLLGDATAWDVGANLIWGQSRKTAEIGVEVVYKSVDQDLPRGINRGNQPGLRNTDIDPSGWGLVAFIQRNW
jgi:hypothetical protein